MRLLFVCTGNLCRSPVAERLTLHWARQSLGNDATMPIVTSAGLAAVAGRPMDPHSAQALTRLGGDPEGFRSRPFEPALAAEADLVVTMTRDQRHSVLEHTPRGLRRTFTLLEAAALLEFAELDELPSVPLAQRAQAFAQRLDVARRYRSSTSADDVADPIGRAASVHRGTAEVIGNALRPLTLALFGPPEPSAASPASSAAARP